jgi:hypothetical protein
VFNRLPRKEEIIAEVTLASSSVIGVKTELSTVGHPHAVMTLVTRPGSPLAYVFMSELAYLMVRPLRLTMGQ